MSSVPATAQDRIWQNVKAVYRTDLYDVAFATAEIGVAVGDGTRGYRTTDAGVTWTSTTSQLSFSLVQGIEFADTTTGYTISMAHVYKTTDAGLQWYVTNNTNPMSWGNVSLVDIDFHGANYGMVVSHEGGIWRTQNGGNTWEQLEIGTTDGLSSVKILNDSVAVVGSFVMPGRIYRTTDAGETWTQILTGFASRITSLTFTDVMTGYATGGAGTLLKTTNGGDSWTKDEVFNTPEYTSVSFTDARNGTLVTQRAAIYRTTDAGATWVKERSITSEYLTSICFTKYGIGIAVGFNGLILRMVDNYATDIKQVDNAPSSSPFLDAIAPNPASSVAIIRFGIEHEGHVSLSLMDALGNTALVVHDAWIMPGTYEQRIGVEQLAQGTYYVRLSSNGGAVVKHLNIVR